MAVEFMKPHDPFAQDCYQHIPYDLQLQADEIPIECYLFDGMAGITPGPGRGNGQSEKVVLSGSSKPMDIASLRIDEHFNVHCDFRGLDDDWEQFLRSVARVVEDKAEARRRNQLPDLTPLNHSSSAVTATAHRSKKRHFHTGNADRSEHGMLSPGHCPTGQSSRRHGSLKRSISEDDDEHQSAAKGVRSDRGQQSKPPNGESDESDNDAEDDDDGYEMREIDLRDKDTLRDWYSTVLMHIQQQHCRSIGQDWIKAVHPKKQAKYPYSAKGSKDDRSSAPPWWPQGVEHKEPAHIKRDSRMKLLLEIICNLHELEGTGRPQDEVEHSKGPLLAHLMAATNEDSKLQASPKAKTWLDNIYSAKQASIDLEAGGRDGCIISLPVPRKKRKSRRGTKSQRRKIEDTREADSHLHGHGHDTDSEGHEEYVGSDSDTEGDHASQSDKESPSTPTSLAGDIGAKTEYDTSRALTSIAYQSNELHAMAPGPVGLHTPRVVSSLPGQDPNLSTWSQPPISHTQFPPMVPAHVQTSQANFPSSYLASDGQNLTAAIQHPEPQASSVQYWGPHNPHPQDVAAHERGQAFPGSGRNVVPLNHYMQPQHGGSQALAQHPHERRTYTETPFPGRGLDNREIQTAGYSHPASLPLDQQSPLWPETTATWAPPHPGVFMSPPNSGPLQHHGANVPMPMPHGFPQQRLSPVADQFGHLGMGDRAVQQPPSEQYHMHSNQPGGPPRYPHNF